MRNCQVGKRPEELVMIKCSHCTKEFSSQALLCVHLRDILQGPMNVKYVRRNTQSFHHFGVTKEHTCQNRMNETYKITNVIYIFRFVVGDTGWCYRMMLKKIFINITFYVLTTILNTKVHCLL